MASPPDFGDGVVRSLELAVTPCNTVPSFNPRISLRAGDRFRKSAQCSARGHSTSMLGESQVNPTFWCDTQRRQRRRGRPRNNVQRCSSQYQLVRWQGYSGHYCFRSTSHGLRPTTHRSSSPLLPHIRYHRFLSGRHRLVDCPTRLDLRSRLLEALEPAAGDLGSYGSKCSSVAVRDTCNAIGGRRQRLRRNLHTILTQNCLGLKTATRKTELVHVLRQRQPLAVCLQETWRAGV